LAFVVVTTGVVVAYYTPFGASDLANLLSDSGFPCHRSHRSPVRTFSSSSD